MLECTKKFYENLFKKHEQKTATEIQSFLSHTNIPKFSEDKAKLCDEDLSLKDLCGCLKIMQNYKSPGNDGWTKEFYEAFWIELTDIFIDSVSETKEKGHLSTSQRQDIIRLIKKKIKKRDSKKNWRRISLLNEI